MTFHIGLDIQVVDSAISLNVDGMTKERVILDETQLDYWSNQVPERGDHINYWSPKLKQKVELSVISRTWNVTGNTGGPREPHDVNVRAYGVVTSDEF